MKTPGGLTVISLLADIPSTGKTQQCLVLARVSSINRSPSQTGNTMKQDDRVNLQQSQHTPTTPPLSSELHKRSQHHAHETTQHRARRRQHFSTAPNHPEHISKLVFFRFTFLRLSAHPRTPPPATRFASAPPLFKARAQHPAAQNLALMNMPSWGDMGVPRGPDHAGSLPVAPSPIPPPSKYLSAPTGRKRRRIYAPGRMGANQLLFAFFRLLSNFSPLLRLAVVVFAAASLYHCQQVPFRAPEDGSRPPPEPYSTAAPFF